ncbi:MAG: translation initiation factor IF-2 [Pirellulaceae bacterium]|nr:translation initiation factor IF-2 [Pirellulaceae bacterium]
MPMRIYALAKELKIEAKELVDICTKAGITGKGSALASLDDDELKKVKAFLSAPVRKPARPAEPAPVPVPPVAPPQPAAQPAPEAPLAAPVSLPVSTPPTPEEKVVPAAAFARSDYIPPAGSAKIKVIGRGARKPPAEGKRDEEPKRDEGGDKPKRRREPVINLAKLPDVKQPVAPPPAAEPKAQKPDLRLPQDALTRHRKSKRAPLEEVAAKRDRKAKSDVTAKPPVAAAPTDAGKTGRPARRSGKPGEGGEGETGLADLASARADRQKARRTRSKERLVTEGGEEEGSRPGRRRPRTLSRRGTNTAAPRKGRVALALPCTVRSFSEASGIPAGQVQRVMMGLGVMATINAQIDNEMVDLVAAELGVELDMKQHESLEDAVLKRISEQQDEEASLESRPPVVTFLGHVDHGKTSLLDYLIGTNVVSGEAGGITQHIRAYQISKDGRLISFVDTPGHEAFTEMRARGANVTDVAVLVIAADDGIMPQTEEAISHAKAAGVPIVVALNKIDLPGVDPTRILTQLTEHELTPSEWGGEIEVVRTSAITGQGMDELLETLLTIADINEYKANPHRPALGVCLEAEQEGGRGVIAKLIVKNGTLQVGDVVVCGGTYGRVKAMYDTLRTTRRVKSAGPSMPVNVTGFDQPPQAGDAFYVLDDIGEAREVASQRLLRSREQSLAGHTVKVSFEDFQRRLQEGRLGEVSQVVSLNLIIRADVRGSIEAIQKELGKLEHPEVQIKVLQASVGGITVADVTLAHASQAVVIGFNVIPDEAARSKAEDYGVEIRRYDVIYKVSDDIKALLEGKLKPEERIVELGQALVKQVFSISRVGAIAGCYVARGTIERGCRIRVNREGRTIGDYPLDSLRREKDDVREVSRGLECGIKLAGFNDIKKDDVLEAYRIEEVARSL